MSDQRPPHSDFVFETRQVSIRYGARMALCDVSLQVPRRQIMAVIGPSGCGKTSLLTSLNRLSDLVPGCEVSGQVLFEGEDIYDQTTNLIALRRRVGMIFQRPNPFPLSIRRNIQLPLRAQGLRDRQRLSEVTERVLRDVGLWGEVRDRLDRSALALSGGQQQRLCIARALALDPEVLLLDEPCSALDPIASGVVEDLIRTFHARMTVVIVTHNLAQARRIADHVAMFWTAHGCGTLTESGPAEQLFEQPRDAITAAYLQGLRG